MFDISNELSTTQDGLVFLLVRFFNSLNITLQASCEKREIRG